MDVDYEYRRLQLELRATECEVSESEQSTTTGFFDLAALDPPDISRRLEAVAAASRLRRKGHSEFEHILQQAYGFNDVQQVRVRAGEELGYSRIRIWAHEHQVAAACIMAGAPLGIGGLYLLSDLL